MLPKEQKDAAASMISESLMRQPLGLALIRASYMLAQKGGYRKRYYWSAYKAVLLESSFLDSSACSLIYFFIASSVILLPIVET